jgi:SAM-dependent methyltransferase
MAHNPTDLYDADAHIAEVYDQSETQNADVRLIRRLIPSGDPLQILEPFCGTGRILLPLAVDGHEVTGIDSSRAMIARARHKVALQPEEVQYQVVLEEGDVLEVNWPRSCDLVILGRNSLNELATPEEQEACIQKAVRALKRGGYLYVDNDPMEGELDPAWQATGLLEKNGLLGTCADGARVEIFSEMVWFDAPKRLARFRRRVEITPPDGEKIIKEFEQQKHLVSMAEVRGWLEQNGFEIEKLFGDYDGSPYEAASPRAIFWAKKA